MAVAAKSKEITEAPTLLIVDDEPAFAELLSEHLARAGF